MQLFSDNGRVKLITSTRTVDVKVDGKPERKQLGSIGRIRLAAVTNSGHHVAISPQGDKAIQVYRWTGDRWRVEADYDFHTFPEFIAWDEDEDAWTPELSVRLQDASRHIIYEWQDHWICAECR